MATTPIDGLKGDGYNPQSICKPAVKKHAEGNSNEGEKAEESQQAEADPPVMSIRRGPVTWLSLLLLILTGAGLVFYFDNEKKRHIEGRLLCGELKTFIMNRIDYSPELNNASTTVKQGSSVGKAAIGGPFKLVNHDGKTVTDRDFLGKWTLIYFGFTHCPDICPDELQKLADAVDKIRALSGTEIVPVFISVDPERDTVEQVRDYVKEFHPNLIGLTGNADEIRQVARAYRVYYMKTEEEESDYLVDHSIVMYLMDPDMEFVKFFGKNYDVNTLAEGIIKESRWRIQMGGNDPLGIMLLILGVLEVYSKVNDPDPQGIISSHLLLQRLCKGKEMKAIAAVIN
ncbi:Protein SCO1 1, mitochondrial [Asimina triloba]